MTTFLRTIFRTMDDRKMSFLALILIVLARQVQGVQRVRVDAGMRYPDGSILLIAGDDTLLLKNDVEFETGKTSSVEELPEEFETIIAARGTNYGDVYFLYAPTFYYDLETGHEEAYRYEYSEPWQEFLGNDGPDAVARRKRKTFVFKGCKVAVHSDFDMDVFRKRKVSKLGLPCNPDAAWTSPDGRKIIVLKGDQIWIWDGGRDVDGPKAFSSMYTITSWELIPDGGEN